MGFSCLSSDSSKVFTWKAFHSFFSLDRCLRFGFFFIVLAVVFWGKNNLSDEARQDVSGAVIDRGFDLTAPVNELMLESKAWMMFFEISSSWCIDLIFLSLFSSWIYNGDSFRLILSYAVFYGARAILQAVCVLPYPSGMIWIYPVAPSLVVPYGVTSDFFPSGHVGFCVIAAAEFFKQGWYVGMVICWLVAIYESIIMLSARGHYTIDLVSGAVMAHYVHGWCHLWCKGWWKICIDRIVGPYLLYNWSRNPLNSESYKLPLHASPDMSSPRSLPDSNIPASAVAPDTSTEGGGVELAAAP